MTAEFRETCTVVAYMAGGALIAGRKRYGQALIGDGQLVLTDLAGSTIDAAPLSSVEVDTPAFQRMVGEATFVRMNGNRWTLDFGRPAVAKVVRSRGAAARVLIIFGIGVVKGLRLARVTNRQFREMLLEDGAVDRRSRSTRNS